MTSAAPGTGNLLAISDLHIAYAENRAFTETLRPESDEDWLIVAGDVGEVFGDVEWALSLLAKRYATVVWAPGNHELWTPRDDPNQLRGEQRYRALVDVCRSAGVHTPEDPYPVWHGPDGPLTIAPLFVGYDYSFRPPGARSKEEGLKIAYDSGVVCTDEVMLHPDPYPTRDAWCAQRLRVTEERLSALPAGTRTVLVNHYPLVRDPTFVLRYPEFAQWCGTVRTADWPTRFNAATVVYGHLHIPRTTWHDGIRHIEVSVGYPREWRRRGETPQGPRVIFPGGTAG